MNSPIMQLFEHLSNPTGNSSLYIVLLFFSIISSTIILLPFHECAHAFVAWKLGDNTASEQGRLTLNPLRHIDPIGFACMFLIGFGWAKPVPVNPLRANRNITMRKFMSLTAAAGPASNVLFSLICVIISKIIYITTVPASIIAIFSELNVDIYTRFYNLSFPPQFLLNMSPDYFNNRFMAYLGFSLMMISSISLYLAVFNLIPIPPLDGSKIMYFFLSTNQINFIERYMPVIRIVLLMILITTPFLRYFISGVSDAIMVGINYATFFITL
ncbi:MAG: site-2 protease family protein [Oscillospiraceae bacterium]|nr:site-2 protease family protein [Oscillospiraceae bacterium]